MLWYPGGRKGAVVSSWQKRCCKSKFFFGKFGKLISNAHESLIDNFFLMFLFFY